MHKLKFFVFAFKFEVISFVLAYFELKKIKLKVYLSEL